MSRHQREVCRGSVNKLLGIYEETVKVVLMRTKRVLIIEDDADAASVLEAYLRRESYEVTIAGDGLAGLERVRSWRPDLILLDVMLPGMNGTEVLSTLRRNSDTPVIIVSAMGEAPDRIGALRYGADDYVVKPYNPGEVVARVQAVLRRVAPQNRQEQILRWQELEVDIESMTIKVTGITEVSSAVEATPTEFALLVALMRAPTRAFTRQHLLELCLPDSEALERVVDTHIYNLRKKLESAGVFNVLINVRSVGYRFRQP